VTTSPSSSAKHAQQALGIRLRELRKDAGLTARALASATGQHHTRVSKIEHGVQQVLYWRDRRFHVVLEEQALRTWFGSAEVQLSQLDCLLALMSLPNVSLGIVPLMAERSAAGSAGFWIFDDSLVALEIPTASIEVTRPQEIELYARMFGVLSGTAVYGRAARDVVARIIGELG